MVVVGSNLFSESWNLFNLIISGNITDPSARAKRWILGDFPDVEGANFPQYPIIVIGNPRTSMEQLTFSTSSIHGNDLEISVHIYAKAPTDVNRLSDSIYGAVHGNHAVFNASGVQIEGSTNGEQGTDIFGNQRIHFTEQVFKFKVFSS